MKLASPQSIALNTQLSNLQLLNNAWDKSVASNIHASNSQPVKIPPLIFWPVKLKPLNSASVKKSPCLVLLANSDPVLGVVTLKKSFMMGATFQE